MGQKITPDDLIVDGLSFQEEGHIYRLDGGPRLSTVTEVVTGLGLGADFSNVDSVILAMAGRRGREFHRAMHYATEDDLDLDSIHPLMRARVERTLAQLQIAHVVPIAAEVPLFSLELMVAGTVDLVCQIYENRDLAIIDYKTGSDDGADVQLTLYAMLVREVVASRTGQPPGLIRLFVVNVGDGNAKLREIQPIPIGAAKALVRAYNFIRSRRRADDR